MSRKIISFIMSLVFIINSVSPILAKGEINDSESQNIIYEEKSDIIYISTFQELLEINNNLNGSYRLVDNLDLSGENNFLGIGSEEEPFTGLFDGNNFEIMLNIKNPEKSNLGLFRYVESATISNIRVSGLVEGDTNIGAAAGKSKGNSIFINCENNAMVRGNKNIASLVGLDLSSIFNDCSNEIIIDSNEEKQDNSIINENTENIDTAKKSTAVNFSLEYSDEISGSGTDEDPYLLSNKSHLDFIRENMDSYFKLTNDIDLENEEWEPIGDKNIPFKGSFDGNNYKIKNLKITASVNSYYGFFGYITNGSVINLTLENVEILSNDKLAGGISGYLSGGNITNCSVIGEGRIRVVSGNKYCGGITGENTGKILKCYTTINVENGYQTGGITGEAKSQIEDCFSLSTVIGRDSSCGGLVGYLSLSGTIKNSYFAGRVTPKQKLSSSHSSNKIIDSYFDIHYDSVMEYIDDEFAKTSSELSDINTYSGWDFNNTWVMDDSFNYPYLRNTYFSRENISKGSFFNPYIIETPDDLKNISNGMTYTYKLENDIELNNEEWEPIGEYKNPFKGLLDGNGYKIKNLKITASENSYYGLFGYTYDAAIKNLMIENIEIISNNKNVGAIVGNSFRGVIINCSVIGKGRVKALTGTYCGGIIGYSGSKISKCYTTINVENGNGTGSIAGSSQGQIEDCFSLSTVIGSNYYYGGLVGSLSGTIKNSYFAGYITPKQNLASSHYKDKIINSYFDIHSDSAMEYTDDEFAKTSSELSDINTYSGWDFENTWTMDDSFEYPYLKNTSFSRENISEGSFLNPYIIRTPGDLKNIENGMSSVYRLENDIDLNNEEWEPIGEYKNPFKGLLDGNGYKIKNLKITASSKSWYGLFGYTDNAVIKNLTIENIEIISNNKDVGGIVGNSFQGIILNCSVIGKGRIRCITGTYCGGLVGYSSSKILKCYTTINIENGNGIGGIAGASQGQIEDCFSLSTVIGREHYYGGLVGSLHGIIKNSYFAGRVVPKQNLASSHDKDKIINSYFDMHSDSVMEYINDEFAKTTSQLSDINTYSGWDFENTWVIDDSFDYPYLRNSSFQIETISEGSRFNPYIIETPDDLKNIENGMTYTYKLKNDIDLDNEEWEPIGEYKNPFYGFLDGNGYKIKNLKITASDKNYYGLFGYTYNAGIKNLTIENIEILSKNSRNAGGIVGNLNKGIINNCAVTGNGAIKASAPNSNAYCGGIVGENRVGKISKCYSDINIEYGSDIGGIVGSCESAVIEDSYSLSNVIGVSLDIGGISGYYSNTKVKNCYFGGTVNPKNRVTLSNSSFESSYFDVSKATEVLIEPLTPKTTEELMRKSTFTGWDFENTWAIEEGSSYPYLIKKDYDESEKPPKPPFPNPNPSVTPKTKVGFGKINSGTQIINTHCADPVDVVSGNFIFDYIDFELYGDKNLAFRRSYNSLSKTDNNLGYGFTSSFGEVLTENDNYVWITMDDGTVFEFAKKENGTYESIDSPETKLIKDSNGYIFTLYNNKEYHFNNNKQIVLIKYQDGSEINFDYDDGKLIKVSNNAGNMVFSYTDSHITKITDNTGRFVAYEYDSKGNLTKFTNPDGDSLNYTYDDNHNILEISDFNNNTYLKNKYQDGRVVEQFLAEQGTVYFKYDFDNHITEYTDAKNNKIIYHYDENGKITKQISPEGESGQVFEKGKIKTTVDKNGNKTHYEYDKNGNTIKTIYPDGTFKTCEYNDKNLLTKEVNQEGSVYTYEYNNKGKLIKYTDPMGNITSYEYDDKGCLIRETDPLGDITKNTYDSKGNIISKSDPLGNKTKYSYDIFGRLKEQTLPGGGTTEYFYSSAGKLTKVKDALGNEKTYQINGNGFVTKEFDENGNYTETVYDIMNRPIHTYDKERNKTSYKYDGNGDLISVTDANGGETRYTYDSEGNMLSMIDANDNMWSYKYDANGNLLETKDPYGNIQKSVYDNMNRVIKLIDSRNAETLYTYDKLGRIIKTEDALGNTTTSKYDNNGNLIESSDANGNITKYEYNQLGNLIKTTYPDNSVVTNEYGVIINLNHSLNRVTITTSGEGIKEETMYDSNNRPLVRTIKSKNSSKNSTSYKYDLLGRAVEITNQDGTTIRNEYDNTGLVLKTVYENGISIEYSYNKNGQVITKKDKNDGILSYEYNVKGQVTKITDSLGNETSYEYDFNGNLLKTSNSENGFINYEYDKLDRMSKIIDARGNSTAYFYDENDNLIKTIDSEGFEILFKYDLLNREISNTESGFGTNKKYYDPNGNLTKITDNNANSVVYEYNELNLLTKIIDADGNTSEKYYNKDGEIIKSVDFKGAETEYNYDSLGRNISVKNALGDTIYFEYDKMDRVIKTTDANGNNTSYNYNNSGNLVKIINPDNGEIEYTYNNSGNILTETNPENETTFYDYNLLGQLISITDSLGNTEKFEYNSIGNIISATDKNGNKTRYEYDDNGNLTRVIDAKNHSSFFNYDKVNRLTEVKLYRTDGNINEEQITSYQYDARGFLTKITNDAGFEKINNYDSNGNLIKTIDEDGYITTYTYNKRNLLESIIFSDGRNVNYKYDNNGDLIKIIDWLGITDISRDLMGKIEEVNDHNNKNIKYSYDSNGNKSSITYPDNSVIRYEYDNKDNLIKLTNNSGDETTFNYDKAGRVTQILNSGRIIKEYGYDGNGKIFNIDSPNLPSYDYLYDTNGNVITESRYNISYDDSVNMLKYGYDELGRIISVNENGDEVIKSFKYDSLGNLIQEQNNNNVIEYKYNNLNQLINKISSDTKISYDYDKRGNLVKKIETNLNSSKTDDNITENINLPSITDDDIFDNGIVKNQEFSILTNIDKTKSLLEIPLGSKYLSALITTDLQEDTESEKVMTPITDNFDEVKKITTYTYDSTNRMIKGINSENKESHYTYNGKGNLIKHSNETEKSEFVLDFASDIPRVLVETKSDGEEHKNIYGLSKIYSEIKYTDNSSEKIMFNQDKLGSDLYITDDAGNVKSYIQYDEWGNPKNLFDDGNLKISPSYTGHTYDKILDIYFANSRMYSPENKSMMSQDKYWTPSNRVYKEYSNSIPSNESILQSSNLYSYCINNPINYIDSTGNNINLKIPPEETKEIAEKTTYVITSIKIYLSADTTNFILAKPTSKGWLIEKVVGNIKAPHIFYVGAVVSAGIIFHYAKEIKVEYESFTGEDINIFESIGLGLIFGVIGVAEYIEDGAEYISGYFKPSNCSKDTTKNEMPSSLEIITETVDEVTVRDATGKVYKLPNKKYSKILDDKGNHETYYRTMSESHYKILLKNRRISPSKETFISPTYSFSESYSGITIRFRVRAGTTNALESVGVRDNSKHLTNKYPNMPLVKLGWNSKNAYFKYEKSQVNIGLGRGTALEIFNKNIIDFKVVGGR